jgi:hypothetical protein
MKDIIITIIFILLMLAAVTSAYAQEGWHEAAESSCPGYVIDSIKSKPIKEARIEGVALDKDVERQLKEMPGDSSFAVREFKSAPAGSGGNPLPLRAENQSKVLDMQQALNKNVQ